MSCWVRLLFGCCMLLKPESKMQPQLAAAAAANVYWTGPTVNINGTVYSTNALTLDPWQLTRYTRSTKKLGSLDLESSCNYGNHSHMGSLWSTGNPVIFCFDLLTDLPSESWPFACHVWFPFSVSKRDIVNMSYDPAHLLCNFIFADHNMNL